MTVGTEAERDPGEALPDEENEVRMEAPAVVEHFTEAERAARGRAARAEAPRASHSNLESIPDRNPVGLLEEQATSRVPELVPIRYGRMLVSPFTFYRGAAAIMARDLVPTPRAGLKVQLCGDAHLSNFGGFASPERSLVFDLNDFDETLPGPFEWDVKRLAASFEIAGRDRNFSDAERRTAVLSVLRSYREAMRGFATMANLELWYSRLDAEAIAAGLQAEIDKKQGKAADQLIAKARSKDSMKAFAKLTQIVDGVPQIVSDPPLIVPIRELVARAPGRDIEAEIRDTPAGLPALAAIRPPPPARGVPLRRHRAQGRGGGQRRYSRLDHAPLRQGRGRPALLADQGGAGLGARAAPRQERFPQSRPARGRGSADDAGRKRHLPWLGPQPEGHRRRRARLLRPSAVGLEDVRQSRRDLATRTRAIRKGLRLDARTGARTLRRSDRDRRHTSARATPSTVPLPTSRSPTRT